MHFYIYEHWRPDLDIPFYVGKGTGRRAQCMSYRNQRHRQVQAELAALGLCVEVRLVCGGLSSDEAFKIEATQIAFWRASGLSLTNIASGGGRSFNLPKSHKWRRNIAKGLLRRSADAIVKHYAAVSSALTGLVRSQETRLRISASKSNPSSDTRQRNREAAKRSWSDPVWRANQVAKRIGVIRITDGVVNRTIRHDEEIPAGWRRGMTKSNALAN
jgi:hypothetical protein